MENVIVRMLPTSCLKIPRSTSLGRFLMEKRCSTDVRSTTKKPKHPYRNIHPWKSVEEFSKSLVAGVIHNKDGLVAINKPYGISGKKNVQIEKAGKERTRNIPASGIVNEVTYSLTDALPHIAQELGYSQLTLISTPERFTSGVTLLAADTKVENAVAKSVRRAQGLRIVPKTFWGVTTRVPSEIKGEKKLAMEMQQAPKENWKLPVIIESWTHNQQKRRDVKILNVQFKTISNSTDNLSSLMEIKSSTKKWHAVRLFAATVLYSPILGDNIYGSRVQNVMGKWMNVSPFVDAAQLPPKLNADLLQILRVPPANTSIIPVHLHMREIYLPSYGLNSSDLVLTAPPMPEFLYTARRLKFKHEAFEIDEKNQDDEDAAEHSEPARHVAVT